MRPTIGINSFVGLLTALLLASCQAVDAQQLKPTGLDCLTPAANMTAEACLPEAIQESTPIGTSSAGPRQVLSPTPRPLPEKTPPVDPSVTPGVKAATDSSPGPDELTNTLFLARPIASPANDQTDATYRFGSTQGKKRDPHHGVEFLNPQGTPVLAAADGVVVAAGDDKKTLFSPYFNFYGSLVVIEHQPDQQRLADTPDYPKPIYTLYAHLAEVLVQPGQKVRQGEEIGKVGMTGGATGSHLHFEVRLGENSYAAARNPELWLKPGLDETGELKGALAVQVTDPQGKPVAVKGVVIAHLPEGPGSASDWEVYVDSYEEKVLLGNSPWQESFAAGELPAGWYRVTFPYLGLQRQEVQVLPGRVNLVKFAVQ